MNYRYRATTAKAVRDAFLDAYVDIPSIADAKDGFWVNEHNEFTRGEDALFWIPPAQIIHVEKINVGEGPCRQNRYD